MEEPITGACRDCRHFISDKKEVFAEIKFLNNNGKVVLHTAERTGGEGTRTVDYKSTIEQALMRLGLPVERIGLCEKGVARFVDNRAGLQPDDKCSKWKEKSVLYSQSTNWRKTTRRFPEDLQKAERTAEQWVNMLREITPFDPCPCDSGNVFGRCCAPLLKIKSNNGNKPS